MLRRTLPIVLAGTFMVVLDFFIVNVALPSMQTSLNASSGALEWVAAGYGLTSAVFLITSARLGDRIGRRRVFSLGLALFTLSSVACGAATSSEKGPAGASPARYFALSRREVRSPASRRANRGNGHRGLLVSRNDHFSP